MPWLPESSGCQKRWLSFSAKLCGLRRIDERKRPEFAGRARPLAKAPARPANREWTEEPKTMYDRFETWVNRVLVNGLPPEARAIGFNLYEDADSGWSIQMIASASFDEEDWMCDEVFTTGEDLFSWKENANWEHILKLGIDLVKQYLENGKYAALLKGYDGVGVGFADGDVEIVYKK